MLKVHSTDVGEDEDVMYSMVTKKQEEGGISGRVHRRILSSVYTEVLFIVCYKFIYRHSSIMEVQLMKNFVWIS